MQWYYAEGGQQKGPVEDLALDELVRSGTVRDDTLVWCAGMEAWEPHGRVRGQRGAPPVVAAPPSEVHYCSECGRPFPANELVTIGAAAVCIQCKPIYLQRLRESGEAAVGKWHYGGFWIRVAAKVIDGVLLQIVLLAIRIPLLGASFFPAPGAQPQMALFGLFLLINLVLVASYEIIFVTKRGATIGKMILGLKIIRPDGSGIPPGLSVARYFAQFISSITLGIGYLMAGFDDQKRALHDRICETRVVYSK
jgi:uncharacterized RDD family membrane protein YckC